MSIIIEDKRGLVGTKLRELAVNDTFTFAAMKTPYIIECGNGVTATIRNIRTGEKTYGANGSNSIRPCDVIIQVVDKK